MHKYTLLTTLFIATLSTASVAAADCRNLYRLTDLNYAVEPGQLMAATTQLPEHCLLNAVVNRAIQVQVRMPTAWNGRFMFSTVGGAAGSIGDTTSLLADGYAMASTDTGHEGSSMEFVQQPEALIDYAYRGVHLATVFAKHAIHEFYGKPVDYSYLQGCSNGGRAALMEAIRFPDDYDGIIAGAPAFRFQEFAPWMIGGARQQATAPLTKDSLQILDDASRSACDTLDGVADGVINDPRLCTNEHFAVDSLICDGDADANTDADAQQTCLTPQQADTAKYMYSNITDNQGNIVSPGVLPGAEAAGDWAFWMLDNPLMGTETLIGGMANTIAMLMRKEPEFDISAFDPDSHRAQIAAPASVLDIQTADLGEFQAHGGKLLMYQGWNDYPLRPQRAIDYLHEAQGHHGGQRKTDDFFRLFMVPGMVHCAGGPGAWQTDYVAPLVTWREKNEAPNRIIASKPPAADLPHLAPAEHSQQESFTRPLCVYPELAQYSGRGDQNSAASFNCAVAAKVSSGDSGDSGE